MDVDFEELVRRQALSIWQDFACDPASAGPQVNGGEPLHGVQSIKQRQRLQDRKLRRAPLVIGAAPIGR